MNEKKKRVRLLVLVSIFNIVSFNIVAQSLTVSADFSKTTSVNDLAGSAGSDFDNQYFKSGETGDITISAVDIGANVFWQVYVRKADSTWPSTVKIFVKRTSVGTGVGSAYTTGGDTNQEVTDSDELFFSGRKECSSIDIQISLEGASVILNANTFMSQLIFTLVLL